MAESNKIMQLHKKSREIVSILMDTFLPSTTIMHSGQINIIIVLCVCKVKGKAYSCFHIVHLVACMLQMAVFAQCVVFVL